MTCSKLKTVFCLTVCLTVLFPPFLFEISSDGKAYAGGSSKGNKISKTENYAYHGYTAPENDTPAVDNPGPAPVPEPAT